jgi:hypothetical protein
MHSCVKYSFIRSCLILIFALISFSVAIPQDAQNAKEIDEAINNVKNGKYDEAIPVLKKYAELKGFDDFKSLEIKVYLNLSYLATKNKALDVSKVNALTDAYFAKYVISKTDSLKSSNEMMLIYFVGIMNDNIGNFKKKVFFSC